MRYKDAVITPLEYDMKNSNTQNDTPSLQYLRSVETTDFVRFLGKTCLIPMSEIGIVS